MDERIDFLDTQARLARVSRAIKNTRLP
jgi:hypothetical protein